jgi:hypothetical protein
VYRKNPLIKVVTPHATLYVENDSERLTSIIEGKQVAERVKVEEASRITGVPVGTLRFWRATDQGPRSYVVGRRLWYDVADLESWLADQKARSVRGGAA